MVTLHWSYHEIADTDYTAVEIEIYEQDRHVETWANFDRDHIWKEVWGNQTEKFVLPSLGAARLFIASAGCYELVAPQVSS
ncbi:hypothetical protein [Prosthecobacter sp.]|uniref:hypothetical protein n=1 Tax=Prosthecobacter sp. TaxID=1965333 RepID=UPI00378361BE